MTRVYIVRHCETDGNALKVFQGLIDTDINALGVKQLYALQNRFGKIKLDAVYTSPLIRAVKTATALSLGKKIPCIADEGLIEVNGGVYEGKTYKELGEKYPEFSEMWQNKPWQFAPENGETMPHAYDRIWKAVNRIARENDGKCIAIVTHGFVARCLFCKILKDSVTSFVDIPFGTNTAVSLLEFDCSFKPRVVYLNDTSHLTDTLINKNARVPLK